MSAVEVEVLFQAAAWSALPDAAALVERAVQAACDDGAGVGVVLAEGTTIVVLLTDDAGLRALNRHWRGKDSATNVLSFPAPEVARAAGEPHLGDIAIAFETVEREAAADGKRLADHLTHLGVHGALHLLGYDHEITEDAEAMEALERAVLARLGVADPYADTDPIAETSR
ncbi:MAG TPA: rRNA maturation RNase YbeY [Xanthobacteraceae bacterium]|nr:rRNA maturation RNase YbeY [Xanthobacteraceae bacterium]